MGNIYCLMGKSSSGKDTIFKLLLEDPALRLKPVIPYTTRPRRNNETHGTEYFFVDESKLQTFESQGRIIEKRVYNTINGLWYYCTIDDGQVDLSQGNYIIITTLEAFGEIRRFFGDEHVVAVYIEVEDGLRLERALHRERQQKQPNYDELCRRFLADNVDFSRTKLHENGITRFYDNSDLDACISAIKATMLNQQKVPNNL